MPGAHRPPVLRARALLLLEQGWSLRAIGRELDVHHSTVSWWRDGGGATPLRRPEQIEVRWTTADRRRRDAWSYLLGMYLGDGHVDGHGRLRIACDSSYPGIIDEVDAALRCVGVRRPWHTQLASCRVVGAGTYGWATILPTGRGPKHGYQIRLRGWQRRAMETRPHLVLRGLVQSDGCRFINVIRSPAGRTYTYPTYDFKNEAADIHAVFEACCSLLGVRTTVASAGRSRRVARREDVRVLDLAVGAKR